jgi:hypothetical protein
MALSIGSYTTVPVDLENAPLISASPSMSSLIILSSQRDHSELGDKKDRPCGLGAFCAVVVGASLTRSVVHSASLKARFNIWC